MTDRDLYRELSALTKKKEEWQSQIPFVGQLLENHPPKITAKALWLLGEMGLQHPEEITPYVAKIASFLDSPDDLLCERALNALGRIGRARASYLKPYWDNLFPLSMDGNPRVRLSFIWASENIATNAPEVFKQHLQPFVALLHDTDDKVRIEAPEMFRVLGKRCPQMVEPYLDRLQWMSENDPHPIVRIHSAGAIRITTNELKKQAQSTA